MSGKKLKSSIADIHSTGVRSGGNTASIAPTARSSRRSRSGNRHRRCRVDAQCNGLRAHGTGCAACRAGCAKREMATAIVYSKVVAVATGRRVASEWYAIVSGVMCTGSSTVGAVTRTVMGKGNVVGRICKAVLLRRWRRHLSRR